ncbi:flagellar biosynthesis protein FlhF [Wenzhouxiangella sp. AB-CW3]|uniref:flagellar biosynthesis protein FlhF n=1 Tax=Wenzhouxiangella sp. AB-CW3 TaxID=2771012 RepID=UPI00168B8D9D|nr:flagellar biosynthesis protein FlhF [Wenzhouxiangella sp. AB-CW3]QOC21190.1 flagellar biosynthesis protein FlhF [Wenzhouxiangella sp. AB-CW3]
MKIKRYVASDMRQALRQVREEQGPDAVILSTRTLPDGLELIAAVDYDETLIDFASDRGETGGYAQGQAASSSDSESDVDEEGAAGVSRTRSTDTASDTVVRPMAKPAPTRTRRVPRSTPKPAILEANGYADEAAFGHMKAEIAALRQMLESQLSSLAWNDLARSSPARAAALRDLVRIGLAPDLAQDLVSRVGPEDSDLMRILHASLGELTRRLKTVGTDPLKGSGVVALVGPTGVGKTTTIAKLAARHAQRHGPENVALISADDYRIGAQEQLFTYGRMLNIPVYVATSAEQLHERVQRLEHADLVLVDTAGIGQRDQRFERVLESLDSSGRRINPYLVLAANAQIQSLEEAVAAFRQLPLAGGIVTKLDEAGSLGGLLSVLERHKLPLAYTADGQQVPENLRRASTRNLVRRAIELMKESGRKPMNEDYLAQQFGEIRHAHA